MKLDSLGNFKIPSSGLQPDACKSLCYKELMELRVRFELTMGFPLRLTKPLLSAIQPTQHNKNGRVWENRTPDFWMKTKRLNHLTNTP